jgi:hypothetical protein
VRPAVKSLRQRMNGPLPDFIIIGVQRGGTTSLYDNLTRHPRIAPALRKEIHFFDNRYAKGKTWYRNQFSRRVRLKPWMITGEASPYYIFHPSVPERILATCPRVKLIILLRDPVARAFSHYHMMRKRDREPLSFEDALKAETERLRGEIEKLSDPNYQSFAHQHQSYVSRGIYADQIASWFERFPRERFLILSSEEFYADPAPVLDETFRFLGVRPIELTDYAHRNRREYKETIDPETERCLRDFYRPHNDKLFALLGRDLPWR